LHKVSPSSLCNVRWGSVLSARLMLPPKTPYHSFLKKKGATPASCPYLLGEVNVLGRTTTPIS
jgi:hypothetical protein